MARYFYELEVQSSSKNQMIDITAEVKSIVKKSFLKHGVVIIFTPHTTAAITTNENADPDVKTDMLRGLELISPDRSEYRHYEGNSDAHIKSSIVGVDQTIILHKHELVLGTWQGIYFCEFDGPRKRKVYIKILED